jgi:hypothetical protein
MGLRNVLAIALASKFARAPRAAVLESDNLL